MIRFLCPRCGKRCKAPDHGAGQKTSCPRCGQRLQVPFPVPVQNQTVLGQHVPDPDTSSLSSSAATQPSPDSFGFGNPGGGSVPVQAVGPTPGSRKHSGLGIASFVFPLLAACVLVIGLAILVFGAKGIRPFNLSFWNSIGVATPWSSFPTVPLVAVSVFVLVLVVIYCIALLIMGFVRRCPSCGRWWAREYLWRQLIEKKHCYGLVTRTAYTDSWGSYSGSSTDSVFHHGSISSSGTTRWKERVPVIRSTHDLHYCCEKCDFHWTRREVKEVEDFDRS